MACRTTPLLLTMLALQSATVMAQSPIVLPGDKVFPENLSSDKAGNIYVGNLGNGGVFRVKPNGSVAERWIKAGAYGSSGVLGVLADDRSNTLWVCSNNLSAWGLTIPGDTVSALKGFDLKTGEGKLSMTLPTNPSLCNDITIGPDGSAYVSNSSAPEILRLAPNGKTFEIWFSDPALQPPKGQVGFDGLAFGDDGNLYFNRYDPADLYRIEVKGDKAGKATKLAISRKLTGTDALRHLDGNRFLMAEGGGSVDRVTIRGDSAIVETLKAGFDIPTSATLVGKTIWSASRSSSTSTAPRRIRRHRPTGSIRCGIRDGEQRKGKSEQRKGNAIGERETRNQEPGTVNQVLRTRNLSTLSPSSTISGIEP